jgi:tRNA nucleotidyltransferase/poly(A) polymerase
VFLVGGAVRDLTSGSPVRDLDVAVQGNALKLKKDLEKAGAVVTGDSEATQELYVRFPGGVRMEVGSTLSVSYPKPGKPVVKPANILDDLRRRDFTANAMALSLNEGSYGLLMDPLNGVADIENRELRLVSNYGFIESPVRMIRAARFAARLGWQMEEKTKARYDTGKSEGYISALSTFHRGYELEEIVHEEDPLRVIRGLEHEGWMKVLFPAWTSAKANVAELDKLREAQMQLSMRGIQADASAAQFPLVTAKMPPKDVKALKRSFPRQGYVKEIEALEGEAKKFAAELSTKQAATPSVAWKMLMAGRPEVVLWVAYSTKNAGLQAKFKNFYTEWPQARQKIPYTQMQEMRIVPGIPKFDELVEKIFFELMDGKLGTVEEMKAFLEPYSPPAPPRRTRRWQRRGRRSSRTRVRSTMRKVLTKLPSPKPPCRRWPARRMPRLRRRASLPARKPWRRRQ